MVRNYKREYSLSGGKPNERRTEHLEIKLDEH